MTLELSRLARVVGEMGRVLAEHGRDLERLMEQARSWLAEFADQGPALRDAAVEVGAAVPTAELLDTVVPLPDLPERFTVIGADGSQIQPDRHGAALYYLVNIGSLVYRHGSGQTPEARSIPDLRYLEEDLYEGRRRVEGNLLDVRRDQAEVAHLAELVEAEPAGPTLALVDGTLILWVLEDLPAGGREERVRGYLRKLDRIRKKGAAVAAFTSKPGSSDVARLLNLARLGGDVRRAGTVQNPLERLPDWTIFSFLPPGSRSALFVSPSGINQKHYTPQHRVHFFYVNVADEEEPVVARVEVPAWVVGEPDLLALAHGGVVAQSRIVGGFPYVLARADELAYISGPERARLEEMVGTAMLMAGVSSDLSPKAYYKSLTRRGRRW